jgi:membrane protease subunit (stomatin/prohibitin family)
MKSELLTALQPALAKISEMGIRYSAIPAHTKELADVLNAELDDEWFEARGIKVEKFGVNSITLPEEIEKQISDRQMAQTMRDPNAAAAVMTNAAANAMQDAANNSAGAMTGFMGMGMAQGFGGGAAANMFAQGQQPQGGYPQPQTGYPMAQGGGYGTNPFEAQQPAQQQPTPQQPQPVQQPTMQQPAGDGWTCPQCGNMAVGNFCNECGTRKPEPKVEDQSWTCPKCGTDNSFGKFCCGCGSPRV